MQQHPGGTRLSARGLADSKGIRRILNLARTIVDLAGREKIQEVHLTEAIQN